MESEAAREPRVARNQNTLYVLPFDPTAVPFLAPALERADLGAEGDDGGVRLLVLVPDADSAVTLAAACPHGALPATAAERATRLLATIRPSIIVAPPAVALELVHSSALKLDRVQSLVIAWADIIAESGQTDALESVMTEVPKDAVRAVVASRLTPEVKALVDRYAWRARPVGTTQADVDQPASLRYAIATPRSRPDVLRRVLDALDPPTAAVYARGAAAAADAEYALRALGYDPNGPVSVVRGAPAAEVSLVVFYDSPLDAGELRAVARAGAAAVALVTPAQVAALGELAGGTVSPLSLDDTVRRARDAAAHVRDELRSVLTQGTPYHELLAIEPLLDEFDGALLAAAALRLLEGARARPETVPAAAPDQPASAERGTQATPAGATARLFVNLGARDHVAPRDLVGAIANEAGVPGSRIGRVEIRDTHALVEVPAAQAEQIAARITGITVRGRRVAARLDRGRREREDRR